MFWSNALVLLCWAYDWRKTGRIHPVFVWGGVFLVGFQFLSLLLADSAAWAVIANCMLET